MTIPPPLPAPSRALTIPGFTLGHGSDREALTGVTVILCPEGALAAAEVRGSATGTRQFDSLVSAQHVSSKAHAVVLAGGSGFGLSAADPVVDWLARHGYGFQTGVVTVPIVPTAILFDLALGRQAAPSPALVAVRDRLGGAGAGRDGERRRGHRRDGGQGERRTRQRHEGGLRLRQPHGARTAPPSPPPWRSTPSATSAGSTAPSSPAAAPPRTPTSSPTPSGCWRTCRPIPWDPGRATPPSPW